MRDRDAGSRPEWASIAVIRDLYGVPIRQLFNWCRAGSVRTVKWTLKTQGARRFSVRDVEAAMDALSAGKQPKRVKDLQPPRESVGEWPSISGVASVKDAD